MKPEGKTDWEKLRAKQRSAPPPTETERKKAREFWKKATKNLGCPGVYPHTWNGENCAACGVKPKFSLAILRILHKLLQRKVIKST